jgi:NADP-dependent 3-hydroxy acid dehydrogenase YdfG
VDALNSIPKELQKHVDLVRLDVTVDKVMKDAVDTVKAKLSKKNEKLYALVNNAGIDSSHGNANINRETIVRTNFLGPKKMTDAFAPLLDKTEGRIVNVGSDSGTEFVSK